MPARLIGRRQPQWHDAIAASVLRRAHGSIDVVHAWPGCTTRTFEVAKRSRILTALEVPNTHIVNQLSAARSEADRIGIAIPAENSHAWDEQTIEAYERQYDMADVILLPSEYSRETFIRRGIDPSVLRLHQYGFDLGRWPAPPVDRSDRPFTAIFVGRAEVRKGLHLALRAWIDSGAAERGRFIVCGDVAPWYLPALEPMLSHPSVEVIGFVDDPGAWMRTADVLVLPSVEEGSALVTYEGQASGCVPLVSDATGARPLVPAEHCVHRAGDVATLTHQLRSLDENPSLLRSLREQCLGLSPRTWWGLGPP